MTALAALLGRYRELLAEVDAWFLRCSRLAGAAMACQRGCSACCRGLFDITLLDAFLLQDGFLKLSASTRTGIRKRADNRLLLIQQSVWPDFDSPWLLNVYPEKQWDVAMPDEDETPCPLLAAEGGCLVYDSRPMTCRLHGIPMVDISGEILFDEWCSLNFVSIDPLQLEGLRAPFNEIFRQEQLLFREFTRLLTGDIYNELDTLIPAAVLLDFEHFRLPDCLKPCA